MVHCCLWSMSEERLCLIKKNTASSGGQNILNTKKAYYADHKAEIAEQHKQYRQQLKHEVLEHYSLLKLGYPVCGCCGETDLSKLCIDHMTGGGNAHRKSLNRWSHGFYQWLKRQDYPGGYQTLCLDCNKLKQRWDGENRGRLK